MHFDQILLNKVSFVDHINKQAVTQKQVYFNVDRFLVLI